MSSGAKPIGNTNTTDTSTVVADVEVVDEDEDGAGAGAEGTFPDEAALVAATSTLDEETATTSSATLYSSCGPYYTGEK